MKESKNAEPSVLVLIVTPNGVEEAKVEALRDGARNYLKRAVKKDLLPEPATRVEPGMPPSTVTLSQYHKIQQSVRYINENYRTDIRLDTVAGKAGMSPSHFSRIFRKVMGLSYQSYLNGCRITKAKNLLRTSPQSVTEIAVSLGFADPTGFGRIFKKLTGHTPSAFRSLPQK
ncbi:MAG TPA: helix-turn-helix domain-containing protein [Nitrospirota bacterium]